MDTVAIMDDELVEMIERQEFAELLDRPLGGGWPVAFVCRIRREPISMAIKTHKTRNEAVTETK
jgi:hypothetical protein